MDSPVRVRWQIIIVSRTKHYHTSLRFSRQNRAYSIQMFHITKIIYVRHKTYTSSIFSDTLFSICVMAICKTVTHNTQKPLIKGRICLKKQVFYSQPMSNWHPLEYLLRRISRERTGTTHDSHTQPTANRNHCNAGNPNCYDYHFFFIVRCRAYQCTSYDFIF